MPRCAAIGCNNNGNHSFPNNFRMRRLWEKAFRIRNFKATHNSRLCSEHFTESDYIGESPATGLPHVHRFLKKTAIPSVFSWSRRPISTATTAREQRHLKRSSRKELFPSTSEETAEDNVVPALPKEISEQVPHYLYEVESTSSSVILTKRRVINCIVLGCKSNSADPKRQYELHDFPSDTDLKEQWISNIGKEPSKFSKICSLHFEPSCFLIDTTKKVFTESAVPTIFPGTPGTLRTMKRPKVILSLDVLPQNNPRLAICRICLATDCKMYPLTGNKRDWYETLTGLDIQSKLPKWLCWECSQRLNNVNEFRHKSLKALKLMWKVLEKHGAVNLNTIKHINRKTNDLESSLQFNKQNIIHFNSDETIESNEEMCEEYLDEEFDTVKDEILETDEVIDDFENDGDVENDGFYDVAIENDIVIDNNNQIENDSYIENDGDGENGELKDKIFESEEVIEDYDLFENDSAIENDDLIEYDAVIENDGNDDFIESDGSIENDGNDTFIENDGLIDNDNTIDDDDTMTQEIDMVMENDELEVLSDYEDEINISHLQRAARKVGAEPNIHMVQRKASKYAYRNRRRLVKDDQLENFTIKALSFEDQVLQWQKRKHTQSYRNSYFRCEVCYTGCSTAESYERHMIKHARRENISFKCCVCKLYFRTADDVNYHCNYSHNYMYSCKTCNFSTGYRHSAAIHSSFHKGKEFVCEHCDLVFNQTKSLRTHIRKVHPSTEILQYVCNFCGRCYYCKGRFNQHKRITHPNAEAPDDGPFCETCDVIFLNEEAFSTHLIYSHKHDRKHGEPVKEFFRICEVCGQQFKKQSYYKHMSRKHPKERNKDPPPQTPKSIEELIERSQNRINKTPKMRNRKKVLKGHIMCEQCGKMFRSYARLENHSWVHTGVKIYQCDECGKQFVSKDRLKNHIIQHRFGLQRPYVCDLCGNTFATLANLNRHKENMHINPIRSYKCPFCEKLYKTKAELDIHATNVHRGVPLSKKRKRDRKSTEVEKLPEGQKQMLSEVQEMLPEVQKEMLPEVQKEMLPEVQKQMLPEVQKKLQEVKKKGSAKVYIVTKTIKLFE